MMITNKVNYITFLFLAIFSSLGAQQLNEQYPEVGKPIPEFTLHDIHDYSTEQVNSKDLEGKFVVLYFWSRFCAGTVKSLSRIDAISKKFKGKLDIILVGGEPASAKNGYMLPGHEPGMDALKTLYNRLSKMQDMQTPEAYDPELFQRFVPGGYVPHAIWIDDKGIVKAITNTLQEKDLEMFLQGNPFEFNDTSFKAQQEQKKHKYDIETPFLVDGNGGKGSEFIQRSLLAEFKESVPGMPFSMEEVCQDDSYYPKGKLEGYATLEQLYKLAYLGYMAVPMGAPLKQEYSKDYNHVLLETKDIMPFMDYDFSSGDYVYVYSLIVPPHKAIPEHLMQVMQNDLKNYFGYKASVETRTLPYWSIQLSDRAKRKLKTKGGSYAYSGDNFTKIGYKNVSVDVFLNSLFYLTRSGVKMPILDETGMKDNIDVPEMDVLVSDFSEIKKFLYKLGFTVEISQKPFRVIVISDNTI